MVPNRPLLAAPEVMLAAAYGKAADMWSVGTIFAELLRRK